MKATLHITNSYNYQINIIIPHFTNGLFREIKLFAKSHYA